jgi:hypothetical protein
MKKFYKVILIFCIIGFFIKFPIVVFKINKYEPVPSTPTIFNLSDIELLCHIRNADNGDATSCDSLDSYYELTKHDKITALYWRRRADELRKEDKAKNPEKGTSHSREKESSRAIED